VPSTSAIRILVVFILLLLLPVVAENAADAQSPAATVTPPPAPSVPPPAPTTPPTSEAAKTAEGARDLHALNPCNGSHPPDWCSKK
jgi:hypothetical protein